ncbi:MAG: hypothetical protein GY713_17060 [Actinomycetia bacterium]|nr:hypothetical protein [Actinomycetes bacterium]
MAGELEVVVAGWVLEDTVVVVGDGWVVGVLPGSELLEQLATTTPTARRTGSQRITDKHGIWSHRQLTPDPGRFKLPAHITDGGGSARRALRAVVNWRAHGHAWGIATAFGVTG